MATKLSVAECRKYIPSDLELTDKQVERVLDGLLMIANAVFDWKLEGKKNEKSYNLLPCFK